MTAAMPFERTLQYAREHETVRPRDIETIGIPREHFLRLNRKGKLSRRGHGICILPDAAVIWLSKAS
jgi:hypothetical protein